MGGSISFSKRELEKKKIQKRKEKQKRKEERKANSTSGSMDEMIAYVDEYGVISNQPPSDDKKEVDAESISVSTPKKEKVEDTELRGRVEYFKEEKGYGFIKNTATVEKYFFHVTCAFPEIKEGNIVTFELEKNERGLNAVNIRLAK